jgi:hypothetical protein
LDIFVLFFRISFETRFLINSVTKNNFGHFCSFFEFYSTIYKLNIFRLFTIFVNSFTNRVRSRKIPKLPKIFNDGVVFIIKLHFYSCFGK